MRLREMTWKVHPDPTAKGALAIKEVDSYKLTIHFLVEDNTLDKDEDFGFLLWKITLWIKMKIWVFSPMLTQKDRYSIFQKRQIKGGALRFRLVDLHCLILK